MRRNKGSALFCFFFWSQKKRKLGFVKGRQRPLQEWGIEENGNYIEPELLQKFIGCGIGENGSYIEPERLQKFIGCDIKAEYKQKFHYKPSLKP